MVKTNLFGLVFSIIFAVYSSAHPQIENEESKINSSNSDEVLMSNTINNVSVKTIPFSIKNEKGSKPSAHNFVEFGTRSSMGYKTNKSLGFEMNSSKRQGNSIDSAMRGRMSKRPNYSTDFGMKSNMSERQSNSMNLEGKIE